ncbi:MAG: phosphotransferase family protein [Anaerolineaceae bacterium]|nr:phosphotransferase family protein [Anaerolineaceae bacterium]
MSEQINIDTDFRQRITEYLEAVADGIVKLETLQELPGGTSRDNWLVGVKVDDQEQQFLLRRDRATTYSDQALEREQEFAVLRAAHASGVRVTRPRWYCIESTILGAPFLVSDYIEGIAIGSQVVSLPNLADARKALPEQMGEQLARIHAIDHQKHRLDFLPKPQVGRSPAQEAIHEIRRIITNLGVHNPVFSYGLRWAENNLPTTQTPVVLHGDFRIGNIVVDETGLQAIIDWEFCRLGDPLEDLAWVGLRDWRYGRGDLPLGGVGEREPFIAAYESASKLIVNRADLDFWEILGNLRWAVVCLAQAERHCSGKDRSVELAVLGRRSAAMQHEMLRLIQQVSLSDNGTKRYT